MVDALSSSEYVQEAIKNLDEIDKQGVLIAFAKSFELKAPTKNAKNWHLSFEWHDNLEGVRLFDDAILKTLVNIRNVAKENIDDLATTVDIRNSRELESLHNEMSLIENKQMGRDKKRIQYKLEMIHKEKKYIASTIETLALYVDLNKRKVAEFEDDKNKLMDSFIDENKKYFIETEIKFLSKLKK